MLFISSEFPPGPGGIGRHAADVTRAFYDRGYKVVVCTPMDYATPQEKKEFLAGYSKEIHINELKRYGLFTYLFRIVTIVKVIWQENPKNIYVSGKFPIWLVSFLKILVNKSVKIHAFVHGSEVQLPIFWQRKLYFRGLKAADEIWPVSHFTKSLLPVGLIETKSVRVLPNGLHSFQWADLNTIEKYDWSGQPKLLTVGSITKRKGQHRVVRSLPKLLQQFPSIHYHIIGLPNEKNSIREILTEYELEANCTMHGSLPGRNEIAAAYRSADVFVMLSENQPNGDVEGFGIAILEANYFGLPVIGAKGCGIEDAVQDGYNGKLVDGDEPDEIDFALKDILHNYDRYSKNAKKWAQQHEWTELINALI